MNKINREKVEYVKRACSSLFDASVRKSMGGLGGCKDFNIEDFDPEFHEIIRMYLDDEICSVEGMLIASENFEKSLTA